MSKLLWNGIEYEVIKNGNQTILKRINEFGYEVKLSFTDNIEEHNKAMEAIKEFWIRELV